MKLNAHELAMNRWPDNKGTELGSSASDGQLGARIGCVFAITEVAQPLQDRVEELEDLTRAVEQLAGIAPWIGDPEMKRLMLNTANAARAILAKHA